MWFPFNSVNHCQQRLQCNPLEVKWNLGLWHVNGGKALILGNPLNAPNRSQIHRSTAPQLQSSTAPEICKWILLCHSCRSYLADHAPAMIVEHLYSVCGQRQSCLPSLKLVKAILTPNFTWIWLKLNAAATAIAVACRQPRISNTNL